MDAMRESVGVARRSLGVLISGVLVGLVLCTPSQASQSFNGHYFGVQPDRWKARIVVRDGAIKMFRFTFPILWYGSKQRSLGGWRFGGKGNPSPTSIGIRRGGGFNYRLESTWGKTLLRGRVLEGRIHGFIWDESFDQINGSSWSGYGNKPAWVGFRAWKTKPSQTEP